MATDTICQTCGAIGDCAFLVSCSKCNASAEHRYCMFNYPDTLNYYLIWTCEQCMPTFPSTRCIKPKKHGRYHSPQIDHAGEQCCATLSTKRICIPNVVLEHASNFSVTVADTQKSFITYGRSPEFNYLNGEVLAVNDRQQFREKSASLDDWLGCDIKCNSSLGCLQIDKSLSDQSMSKEDTVGDTSDPCHIHNEVPHGAELDICPDSKTLKSILKASIVKLKRRRAVLDDEEQLDVEGNVADILCNNLDVIGKKCLHAASKSHEGKTVKKKRKLILDDEDVDEVCSMKLAEFTCQFLESDSSNAKVSSAMRQCNNDSLDFKGDKLRKRGGQLILDDEYSGEKDPRKLCVDVVSDMHKGSEPSVDLCSVKDGYCHSPSSIVDTATSINESEAVPDSISCVPALPIIDPVWWGHFYVCNEICLPIVAHLSSNACQRVCRGVRMMPSILCFDKKPISESIPDCFRQSRPTGERIALYFFPSNDSLRPLYDRILGDVIVQNIMWKVVLEEAELLILPSTELLPGPYQKFQGKYYFWGAFRRKRAPSCHASINVARPKPSCIKGFESFVRRCFVSKDAYMKEDFTKPSDFVAAFMKDGRASSHTWGSICDLVEVPIQPSPLNQSTPSTLFINGTDSSLKTDLFGNLRLHCRSMDWKGLWDLIIASKVELVTLQLCLPLLLKECVNPFGLVMDTMSSVFPRESIISCIDGRNHEWACLLLLESLASSMKMSQSSSMLLSAMGIQERARKIADSWKDARKKWLLKSKLTAPPYAHTFLVHVVTFGINVDEEKELYRKLLMSLSWKKNIHDLVSPLGLGGENMISTIEELIGKGAVGHALNLIYGVGLVDRFPPVPLLKYHLAALERTDGKKKIHSLHSVIRCIRKHKLEDEFPVVPLQKLIKRLKNKGTNIMAKNSATASKRNVAYSSKTAFGLT